MGKRQKAVKERHGARVHYTVLHHLRLIVERANQHRRKGEDEDPDPFRQKRAAQKAEPHTGLDAISPPGAKVLADKGGQRQREAGHRQEGKALCLAVCPAPCHRGGAEGIDVGLHDDVRQRDHGVLHAGRHAEGNHPAQHFTIKADAPPADTVSGLHTRQLAEREERAERLAQHRGQRRPADAHLKHRHKQQIQHHIGQGRGDQVFHRAFAVPHRLQDTRAKVVQHHGERTGKIDAEIQHRVRHHVLRCSHQPQNLRGEHHARHREHHTGTKAERHRGVDGPFHVLLIPRAEKARDQHARAEGDTVDKADQQHDQARGRTDGGQRLLSDKVSHNQRIHRIIELLEQIAEKNRNGKKEHFLWNAPHRQQILIFALLHSAITPPCLFSHKYAQKSRAPLKGLRFAFSMISRNNRDGKTAPE